MLVGRQKEKELLDSLLASPKAEFVAVYGRRRVGKTFLIRQHLKNELVFDFTGSNDENNAVQIANFNREFKRQCVVNETKPLDWSGAFAMLSDYLYSLDTKKKAVVFIDELPWLDKAKSGFLPALEYFWNQHGAQMNHLLFVTCGSTSSWIIKKLLNSYGGLHNRVTQSIELKPFSLYETEVFLSHKNLKFTKYQIVQLYMALGGIPFYLQAIKQGKSVNQVIEDLCFEAGSLLSKEFKPLYRSLFKKANIHIAIITALAKHPYGLSREQLLQKTKLPPGGTLLRAIENLLDCGFIKKIDPFGKKNREAIFRVIDFYSIFVTVNLSLQNYVIMSKLT
jgi:AAA+ ATPase superfamily predicted ATPase